MKTQKEYYYTYYSYEEWGRGCKCLPEEDIKYFGSSKDKIFKGLKNNFLPRLQVLRIAARTSGGCGLY